MNKKYEFKLIALESLEIVDFNPNEMTKTQMDHLRKTIKERGFMQPLTITPKEGEPGKYIVMDGAHRLEVFKELKRDSIPCYVVPDKKPIDIKIDLINLNKIKGEFNQDKYNMLLNSIMDEVEFNKMKELLLLEKEDIKSFENFLNEKNKIDLDPETIEVSSYERAKSKTKITLGDIYQLGNHRLMCGDSIKESNIKSLMNGQKADMVFTDPPYGIGLDVNYVDRSRGTSIIDRNMIASGRYEEYKKTQQNKYKKIIGDDKPYDPKHIFDFFDYADEIFLWGADYYSDKLKNRNKGSWIIWDKKVGLEEVTFTLSEFEMCWSKKKHPRMFVRIQWFGLMGLGKEDTKKRVHPTQKPVKLCSWFLAKFSKMNNIIVDLFGGSGSTIMACEQLNRVCYMMEIDPVYCQIIIDRWQDYTGKKAVKINHDENK